MTTGFFFYAERLLCLGGNSWGAVFERETLLEGVHRARRFQFARVKVERFDPKWRRRDVPMHVHPMRNGRRGAFRATRQRDVRVERAYVQLQAGREKRVIEPLPQLE